MSKFGEKVKSMLRNWLQIQPAAQNSIVLQEPLSHQASVIRNQIWYRGEAAELEQLYKPVSYTHLDVYKRQSTACRESSPGFLSLTASSAASTLVR